jgi:hypothetical protein
MVLTSLPTAQDIDPLYTTSSPALQEGEHEFLHFFFRASPADNNTTCSYYLLGGASQEAQPVAAYFVRLYASWEERMPREFRPSPGPRPASPPSQEHKRKHAPLSLRLWPASEVAASPFNERGTLASVGGSTR